MSSQPSVAVQLEQTLRTVLRLPRANRTVSDFLFTGLLESPFHASHPLSPSALSTSLTLAEVQDLDSEPNLMYPPYTAHSSFPKHLLARAPPTGQMRSRMHTIYLPVASVPPYVLGYFLRRDPDSSAVCFRANPFTLPCVGRFVLDSASGDMLDTVYAGVPASIGLYAIVVPPGGCRERYLMAVPGLPYEWPHLPTIPLWMLSHIEHRTRPAALADDAPFSPGNDVLGTLDAALHADPFSSRRVVLPDAAASLQPWVMSEHGGLADGTWATGGPAADDTAGGVFDCAALQRSLPTLCQTLAGSFYAPSLRLDAPDPTNSRYTSTFTGRTISTMSRAPPTLAHELRGRFASLYYPSALAVSTDRPLLAMPASGSFSARLPGCPGYMGSMADSLLMLKASSDPPVSSMASGPGAYPEMDDDAFSVWLSDETAFVNNLLASSAPEQPSGKSKDSLTSSRKSASTQTDANRAASIKNSYTQMRPIAPRPTDVHVSTTQQTHETNTTALSDQQQSCACKIQYSSREEMLEARRHRNRLSAARSNEKKKLRVATLEKDVRDGRRRLAELTERQQRAIKENQYLKFQIILNRLR